MIYKLSPRRFCLIVDPQRFSSWKGDKREDCRLLNLAIQFIERSNADGYRNYRPGELRCIGFDSTRSGQTIIEFEESFAISSPQKDDCVRFAQLPPGRWAEIPIPSSGPVNYKN